jgi:exopolyphosphatase / guanosine-5'-triphosphate,3'-diphosphate pyrophosphatase
MERLKFAAIDIGSNAVRFLIMSIDPLSSSQTFTKELLLRIPLRLGQESFESGKISEKKLKQLIRVMKAIRHLLKVYEVEACRACATAALREAKNAKEVVKIIRNETTIRVELIDGQEEAAIIYDTHMLYHLKDNSNYLFVDVGGGSTEITLISEGEKVQSFSYKVGTVRMLLEKVEAEEFSRMLAEMEELKQSFSITDIIGSGGNIIKINTLAQVRKGRKLTLASLEAVNEKLKELSVEERMSTYNMKSDRADVITFAADIYIGIAKAVGAKNYLVPNVGLIDGIIHLQYMDWKFSKKNRKVATLEATSEVAVQAGDSLNDSIPAEES